MSKAPSPSSAADQEYPDYKIRIVGLEGNLYFSLPVTDASANNVVNTLSVDELSWNGIAATGVSSTITFDPNGMYGKLSGKCEGGQLDGNFEFYYSKDFSWNVNFFVQKVNSQPIVEKVVGKYIDLSGELDGKISIQGRSTDILKCQGSLALPNPGVLVIKSIDDLLKKSEGMVTLKDQFTKIAVDAFRTYPYHSGIFQVDYTPGVGTGVLNLDGPNGKRTFNIYWHPYEDPDGAKVAKDSDKPGSLPHK